MLIDGILHQVIAWRAVQASLMSVVLVLLAPVAGSAFDVVVTWALTVFVALRAFRSADIAITSLATLGREAVLVSFALVASKSGDSRLAEALTSVRVTRRVVGARRVALAALTSLSAGDVPESVLTFVTVLADHIWLAVAIA